jgi:hypothetical protein
VVGARAIGRAKNIRNWGKSRSTPTAASNDAHNHFIKRFGLAYYNVQGSHKVDKKIANEKTTA